MNKVVHFEITYDDKERCTDFYKKVFDWKLQDIPEMNYTIANTVDVDDKNMPKESGAINGGMYKRDDKSSRTPVIVIDVSSVDDYIKRVDQSGGKVVRPKVQVGDMGFYAQVSDTEDNIIGIWESIKKD